MSNKYGPENLFFCIIVSCFCGIYLLIQTVCLNPLMCMQIITSDTDRSPRHRDCTRFAHVGSRVRTHSRTRVTRCSNKETIESTRRTDLTCIIESNALSERRCMMRQHASIEAHMPRPARRRDDTPDDDVPPGGIGNVHFSAHCSNGCGRSGRANYI